MLPQYTTVYFLARIYHINAECQLCTACLSVGGVGYNRLYMNIQTFLENIITFLYSIILPFLIAIAFLFFIINATRYFIIGGGSEESQQKAKTLALWGIVAFVLILSLWGIVNLFVGGLGFGTSTVIFPDYYVSGGGGN